MRQTGLRILLSFFLVGLLVFCAGSLALAEQKSIIISPSDYSVTENGTYSSMEEVAVYLSTYEKLPANFLTKKQAESLGWNNRTGNLNDVAPGCSIGGDYFGNYENGVPAAKGRKWTECDINYTGGFRGGERIVFSSDGLIYYSSDHYNTFTQVLVQRDATIENAAAKQSGVKVKKNGKYTSRDEVAAYLNQYHQLPNNYLTKDEAKKLGWSNKKDNLDAVVPGSTIGGDRFGNREKLLPDAEGRQWFECDVNVTRGQRSDERIVYSNDGLIYYSPDAFQSFIKLY